METPLQIFCCYAREDQSFLMTLKKHLIPLQREGLVIIQSDIDISPGEEWEQKISHFLNTAQIILLLLSPDFIASEYCYSKEMKLAIERHKCGVASVVPIILRPARWNQTPLGKLQALPTNAEPVTSRSWHTSDDAFCNIAKGIEEVIEKLLLQSPTKVLSDQQSFPSIQAFPEAFEETFQIEKQIAPIVSTSPPLESIGKKHEERDEENDTPIIQEPIKAPPDLPLKGKNPKGARMKREVKRWYKVAGEMWEAKRYEEALAAYSEAIKIAPKNSDSFVKRGDTLDKLGRHEEALAAYEEALATYELAWDDYYGLRAKSALLRKLGKHEEAAKIDDEASHLWNFFGSEWAYA